MKIRLAKDDDNLISLYEFCFKNAYKAVLPDYISIKSLKEKALVNFKETLKQSPENVIVADDSGTLLGVAVIKKAEIVSLYVLPSHQRQGLGQALVLACLDKLKERGINKVCVSVFENNYQALNLYDKLSFTQTSFKTILERKAVILTKSL